MQVLPIRVKFKRRIPDLKFLERKLTETTGVHVTVTPFHEAAGCPNFFIHFRPGNTGKFDGVVTLSISTDTISVENFQDDALQRCPNYFFFHTLAVLEDAGGTPHFGIFQGYRNRKLQQKIPAYACVCWAEWVKLNGGYNPPLYRQTLVWIQIILCFPLALILWSPYFCIILIVVGGIVAWKWVSHIAVKGLNRLRELQ